MIRYILARLGAVVGGVSLFVILVGSLFLAAGAGL